MKKGIKLISFSQRGIQFKLPEETKFELNEKWTQSPAFKPTNASQTAHHGGGSMMLRGCYITTRTCDLQKVGGTLNIQSNTAKFFNFSSNARWLKDGHVGVFFQNYDYKHTS